MTREELDRQSITTLPSMTEQMAQKLHLYGIDTRAELHANIAYQPGVVAYAACVSLWRVELWLAELERDECVAPRPSQLNPQEAPIDKAILSVRHF